MTKTEAINIAIAIAKAEVGYLEKKSNSQLDSKTANAGSANYTKYWRDVYPSYQGQAWCACFVSWVLMQAFGQANAKKLLKHWPYVYCPTAGSLFTKYANPEVGDIVIFHNGTRFSHTGVVTGVNGDYFTTIEGNTSGASGIVANGGGVCAKGYYNSKLPGTKFCRPDWSIVASITSQSTVTALAVSKTNQSVLEWQKWANRTFPNTLKAYCSKLLVEDGEFGKESKKAAITIWKYEMNKVYGTRLTLGNFNFSNTCRSVANKALAMKGTNNRFVTILEGLLAGKGYYTGAIDTIAGSGVISGTNRAQKTYNIEVDGECGAQTWYSFFNDTY